jgi:hypothetical protein
VMGGRATSPDRKGRQCEVDGEEFRQHLPGLRSGDADSGAAMRQVGHSAVAGSPPWRDAASLWLPSHGELSGDPKCTSRRR